MKLKKISKGDKKSLRSEKKDQIRDIRSIVDKTKPFTMMYSGVESEAYFNGCYEMGVRDFLMSYQYVSNRNISKMYGGLGISLFIDSGAFTYMSDPKYNEYTEEQWEKQINEYLRWAKNHRDMIFAIANLDLDYLVGSRKVVEWNSKYFEPFMLETGIPVCFVYHETEDAISWEKHCERYPYVGISFSTSKTDLNQGKEYLRVAEKYNTLVHGMGMTRTSVLPQLPFYTVDSTSWKSGFRYGQLAVWNGTKVQSFGKEDWETKAFKYTRNYELTPPLDEELMYKFYEPEILRANVYAYQRAEEYIRERLKPLAYWFRPESTTRDSIDSVEYPSSEEMYNWQSALGQGNVSLLDSLKEYAKQYNISTSIDDSEIFIQVVNLVVFMNWGNEEYSEIQQKFDETRVNEIHMMWVNTVTSGIDEQVSDLKDFYTEVLLGTNNKLLLLGTNFDKVVKERDSYIEEDNFEEVEVSDEEMNRVLSKFLPTPKEGEEATEISDLDDEIFKEVAIFPTRDEKGRLVKGTKRIPKPKKMYSEKYPKTSCDTCMVAQRCPEYKAGYVCAYNKMFQRYDTRDMGDIIQAMQGIVDFSLMRLQRGMMFENLGGGLPDPNVTNMMNQSMGYLSQLQKMYEVGNQEVIRQTKVMRADGTQEMTTQVSNPQSSGILAQIFGGLNETEEVKEEPIKADIIYEDTTKQE